MKTGDFISAGVGIIANTIVGINNANKQKELQIYLAKLSNEQQLKLADKMGKVQTEIERQRILFEAMALEKNLAVAEQIQKDKNKGTVFLAVGLGVLGVMIFIVKTRK